MQKNESNEAQETLKTAPIAANQKFLTLQKAIDLGEYNPEYLAQFPEWHQLTRHAQFELIKKAIANREAQIWRHWAELNNVLELSKKPHIKPALVKLEAQHKKVLADKEKLFIDYADPEG